MPCTSDGAKSNGVNFSLFIRVLSAPRLINNPASCTRPSSQAKWLEKMKPFIIKPLFY